MEIIKEIKGAPAPVGPYSIATRGAGLLFCSGQIALDPSTNALVEGGIEAQTERVMESLKAVLEGAGSSWGSVLMTTIFLSDMANYKVVNEIYSRYVSPDAPPARQTVAVRELPKSVLVEISVIAE
ncbi:MAG: reactive intermediate/imine deaminase [Deltaproteobacteria bacterium]|nr:reactive intermediate/imine deaminase [Deltaproteobacteria bacterium]